MKGHAKVKTRLPLG